MNPITSPGMYARNSGITHAITGPIAWSSSSRHGPDAQTANATQHAVSKIASANRTVGRIPETGCSRLVSPPTGRVARPTPLTRARSLASHQRRRILSPRRDSRIPLPGDRRATQVSRSRGRLTGVCQPAVPRAC